MRLATANRRMITLWQRLGARYMPFADAATYEMPLGRL